MLCFDIVLSCPSKTHTVQVFATPSGSPEWRVVEEWHMCRVLSATPPHTWVVA